MSPFFSIIVPCYNRAYILEETVQAILRQQETDFELILVDDGSRDHTLAVAEQLAATDPRVRVFARPNGERGAARNFGATQAKGAYLNFFDSDDEMYPNHLRVVREYLTGAGAVEVVHTGYEILTTEGQVVTRVNNFDHEPTNEALLFNNLLACNTVFLRRDIALANPFIEDRRLASAEDWELWLRIASQYRFHSLNEITFCLREHAGRSLNTISADTIIARDQLFADIVRDSPVLQQRYAQSIDYFVANRYTFISLTLALTKQRRRDALKYLWMAVKADKKVLFRRRFLASVKHLL